MNPELLKQSQIQQYFHQDRTRPVEAVKYNPLVVLLLENEQRTKKRSSWLLNFTDKHPLFTCQTAIVDDESETDPKILFTTQEGQDHLAQWRLLGPKSVSRSAKIMSEFGFDQLLYLLSGLEYQSQNGLSYFPQFDNQNPLDGFRTMNQLQALAHGNITLRRQLSLVEIVSQVEFPDSTHALAVFASTVGFIQSTTDRISNENEWNKSHKYNLRDQVLTFCLYKFDHGLVNYLTALNQFLTPTK